MPYSLDRLRQSHIQSQLLDETYRMSIAEIIQQLSYIQIDPISVVARSHDLVVHARSDSYRIGDGWKAFNTGKLFEWFSHARCLLPISHFPYYYRKMLLNRNTRPKWNQDGHGDEAITTVLQQIKDQGPVSPGDIDLDLDLNVSTGWSSPMKRVINYLTTRGYVLTSKRENFQTYVDLTERVIDTIPDTIPDRLETFWFDVRSSLRANGPSMLHRLLHYNKNQSKFIYENKSLKPRKIIKQAVKQGKLRKIKIDKLKYPFYALPDQITKLDDFSDNNNSHCRFLSPFDNALWSRKDTNRLYDFDYKMEIYVPKKDRKYGYYTLPILYGTEFVGRVDVKLHRKKGYIDYKQWTWEEQHSPDRYFWDELVLCIERFNQFHEVDHFKLNGISENHQKEIFTRIG